MKEPTKPIKPSKPSEYFDKKAKVSMILDQYSTYTLQEIQDNIEKQLAESIDASEIKIFNKLPDNIIEEQRVFLEPIWTEINKKKSLFMRLLGFYTNQ